jgi:transcriptional regulator with XRE-family HTH domain
MELSNATIETIEDIVPMNLPSSIDRMRTRQVAERYGIEYNSLHNRMNKLGIKPTKEGRESFLSGEDISLLDRLHNHLSVSGNTFANFIIEEGAVIPLARESSNEKKMELVKSSNVSNGSIVSSELVEILNVFARQQYDVLTPQKKLLEAATHKFLLTTDQVATILGYSRNTISSWESGTNKIGFSFTKIKEGSSTLWQISQVDH